MDAHVEIVRLELKEPFVISDRTFRQCETIRVTVNDDDLAGRGEAVGVYYLGETVDSIKSQADDYFGAAKEPFSISGLQHALPPGGARNAIDCALWDLRCKQEGRRIWTYFDIVPRPLHTVFTLGIGNPSELAEKAKALTGARSVKQKLGVAYPIESVEAVRRVLPDIEIVVDVNQGWTIDELKSYAPYLAKLGVAMIEQPLPRGEDALLADFTSPIPLGADESCQHTGELDSLRGYSVVNIKLDKTGGLTHAMILAREARKSGYALMVGNMVGTSLAMAPGYVVGQLCRYVDLDGPWLIREDVPHGIDYSVEGGIVPPLANLWG